jgi:hypothetical protein
MPAITYGPHRINKAHGWTRAQILSDGFGTGRYHINPTDGSEPRIVEFLSAGSWSNNPADNRDNINTDRVVLCEGAPLPEWAMAWLTAVNAKSCQNGRNAFRAALDDANWNEDQRTFGDDY